MLTTQQQMREMFWEQHPHARQPGACYIHVATFTTKIAAVLWLDEVRGMVYDVAEFFITEDES